MEALLRRVQGREAAASAQRDRVCVREREGGRECVCVRGREGKCVCVCVCVREREREGEREAEKEGEGEEGERESWRERRRGRDIESATERECPSTHMRARRPRRPSATGCV